MIKPHRLLLSIGLWMLLWLIASAAYCSPLDDALQSGDLRYWRELFATPPPNDEWIMAMRSSPIYWLLSPMAWFWLLLLWAEFDPWHRRWRLSTLDGKTGLLALILALPIGWLLLLWTEFDPWHRRWRLSTLGWTGLLALILALPIGWLCYRPMLAVVVAFMGFLLLWLFLKQWEELDVEIQRFQHQRVT